MATIVIPIILLVFDEVNVGWGLGAASLIPMLLGCALIAVGIALFIWTVTLFDREGEGTLAPWDRTRRLVVLGPYRHVRNPMITAVLCVLLGEAALLGSLPLLAWAAIFFVVNAAYMPLVEERNLERQFGEEYLAYKRHVPRWLPSFRAWSPA
jgi:protein-S-isoprenylcysteine O-methyltransferase Ste14